MSQYIILAKANTEPIYYALTTSNHPPTGMQTLQNFCPIVLELLHTIHTDNSSDNLLRTLQIKFKPQHTHSFWYQLQPEHITFIQSITTANFHNIIGLIHKQERKPDLNNEEVQTLIAESLKKAEGALI